MASRRPDILEYPTGFTVLRIFQAVFGLIVIICLAFTIPVVVFAGNCFMMFTASATFLVCIYMLIAQITVSRLYTYWAGVALDGLLLIIWGVSIGLMAAQTAVLWAKGANYCDSHDCSGPVSGVTNLWGYVFAAACGLGVVEFVFFVISLICHGTMASRARRYTSVVENKAEIIQAHPQNPQVQTEYRPFG